MSRRFLTWAVLGSLLSGVAASGADWNRFRGPNGSGTSEDEAPVAWDETTNLKWKSALPGPGSSSPVVVGDRVFVTSWSGYGLSREDPGDQNDLRRHLTSIDRENGKIVWTKTVEPYLPEDEYSGMFAEHGYASHTPVSDGERVYVFFGKTGALAFDIEGNQLWQQSLGTESGPRGWGSASSPILYKDLLIVSATAESESLAALNKSTGEVVWRQEAAGFNGVWGTPVLVEAEGGRTDLVIAVPDEIWGLNPDNGKLRWFCKSPAAGYVCSSAFAHNGVVYAMEMGPRGGGGVAVRAGGKGDVTSTHVLWSGKQSNRIGTPLLLADRIYTFTSGVAACFNANSGEQVFRGRLKSSGRARSGGRRGGRGGQDYASPVLAGGKVYFTSRGGDIHVLTPGERLEQLAVNRVTNEREDFSATPAVSDGQLFIRSSKYLYCVAQLADGADQQRVAEATRVDATAAEETEEADDRRGRRGGRRQFDPARFFAERDANKDGKLTRDEVTDRLRDGFDQLDSDKDDAVTLEEFQSGMRRMFSGRGGGGGGRQDRPERQQRPPSEGGNDG